MDRFFDFPIAFLGLQKTIVEEVPEPEDPYGIRFVNEEQNEPEAFNYFEMPFVFSVSRRPDSNDCRPEEVANWDEYRAQLHHAARKFLMYLPNLFTVSHTIRICGCDAMLHQDPWNSGRRFGQWQGLELAPWIAEMLEMLEKPDRFSMLRNGEHLEFVRSENA